MNDPFRLAKFSSEQSDPTFEQTFRGRPRIRSVAASFNWTWGRSVQQKQRKQAADTPPANAETTPGP